MERYNNHLYPYPPPPVSASSSTRRTDAFTERYGDSQPELCPPSPPPPRRFIQRYAPQANAPLDPRLAGFLPLSKSPSNDLDLTPRQHATYSDLRTPLSTSDIFPYSYRSSSHGNDEVFPSHHSPTSSLQPRSAPFVHPIRRRAGNYYLDDGTAHQDVKEEEEAEEANPTLYHLPHRQNDQPNPFFPDYRARPDHMPFEAGETSPAGMSTQELDNLKRVNQHARDHPFIYPLTNNLAEVEISRNEAAQRSLRGLPPRPLRIR